MSYSAEINVPNSIRKSFEDAAGFSLEDAAKPDLFETNKNRIEENLDPDKVNFEGLLDLACRNGHIELVRMLVEKEIETTNHDGTSAKRKIVDINRDGILLTPPIFYAAVNGHIEIVKFLLEKNAEVDYLFEDFETLVKLLIKEDSNFIELIVQKVVEKDAAHSTDFSGFGRSSALLDRINEALNHSKTDQKELRHRAKAAFIDILTREESLYSPETQSEILIHLSQHPLFSTHRKWYGHGKTNSQIELETKALSSLQNSLLYAAKMNDVPLALKLLENPFLNLDEYDKKGKTVLFYAIQNGNVELVQKLLEKGADPNQLISYAELVNHTFMYSLQNGNAEISMALLNDSRFAYKYLINKCDFHGKTPLCYAAETGNSDFVTMLLEKGASVHDFHQETRKTPLSYAVESGSIDVVNRLLEKVNEEYINQIDLRGRTSLGYAIDGGNLDLVKLLLTKNADVGNIISDEKTLIKLLLLTNDQNFMRGIIKNVFEYMIKKMESETNHSPDWIKDIFDKINEAYVEMGSSQKHLRELTKNELKTFLASPASATLDSKTREAIPQHALFSSHRHWYGCGKTDTQKELESLPFFKNTETKSPEPSRSHEIN